MLNRASDFVGGVANLTALGMKYLGSYGDGDHLRVVGLPAQRAHQCYYDRARCGGEAGVHPAAHGADQNTIILRL